MAITNAYTITEARNMLALWKQAEHDLVTGQAKAYKIGSREFTALDMDEIRKQIQYYSNILDSLEGRGKSTRVVRIIPRDL